MSDSNEQRLQGWLTNQRKAMSQVVVEVISHHFASTHQQSFHKFILLKVYCITDDKTKTLSERIEHLTEYLVVVWLCHVTSSVLTVFLETPVSHCSIHSFLFFPFTQFGFSTRSKPYTFSVDVRVDLTGLQSDLKKNKQFFWRRKLTATFVANKPTSEWNALWRHSCSLWKPLCKMIVRYSSRAHVDRNPALNQPGKMLLFVWESADTNGIFDLIRTPPSFGTVFHRNW